MFTHQHHVAATRMEPHVQPSLSNVGFVSTKDFEQQAELLQGWNQGYAQLSSGAFNGYVSEIRFDNVHLFLEYSSQRLFQNGLLPDDVIAVGVPLQFDSPGLFCGTPCDDASMHIFSGKNGFEFFSPTELIMGGISIQQETLLEAMSDEDQASVRKQCSEPHLLKLGTEKSFAVRRFIRGAFEMINHQPSLLTNDGSKLALKSTLVDLLTECLVGETQPDHMAMSNARCRNIVAETRALIHQRQYQLHSDSPLSVADVCQALGVSRRTLQYCFQNQLNISPIAYLRAERLNGVHAMLKTTHSVTEAAAHWGFWHFGHFSHEYKKMFGELPSVTFKRQRGLN